MAMRHSSKLVLTFSSTSKRSESIKARGTEVIRVDTTTLDRCPFRKTHTLQTKDATTTVPENKTQLFEDIPGPKGLPIVGTLFDYFKKDGPRFNKMFKAYQQRAFDYGPIYKEQIGAISTVVISDPVEYNKVIRSEGKYPNRREMEPMAHYRRKKKIGLGLVNAQGEEWHKHRTVVSKKMLKMKEVMAYCEGLDIVAEDFVKHLMVRLDDKCEIKGLETDLFKWSMESIGIFLFDERIGCLGDRTPTQAQDFIINLHGFFKLMQPLMYNLPIYKLYPTKTWKQYEQYTDNILKIGRSYVDKKAEQLQSTENQSNDHVPFLTYLLSNQSLTPDEALSTATDLLVSATETTTTSSLWILYSLAKNHEVQDKLYKEIENLLPNKEPITPEILSQLSYLKAVVKETFRLYPITFATSRHIDDDLEVNQYIIPAGTHVQGNLYAMYHDPKLYPDPESFKPERWLDGEMDRKFKSLSNLVWGHGARMCIGKRFAEQEMYIMLTKIIQNFKLEYHHEDIEPILNTVMTPDRPLRLKFIPRSG
ncbi:cytochrome P450 10-like isoform X1 [Mytilus galloprovincialis]|uniref:cytochrome P450 10-like isoform X1 n=1 Tax=Mytilus galloprovincialis TaxID=29158 RepID=UPI003F7C38FB